ncbi:MAG: response regulator [candidate division Zixibacteria bacterium]|nr:response regulator [candidate division Zixibacteria bacterium]
MNTYRVQFPAMESDVEILLTDNDPQMRELLEDTLQSIGYRVRSAENLQQANDFLEKSPVDMILLNNELVFDDKYRFVKAVKSEHRSVPIILLVEPVFNINIDEARSAGVDDFLRRPFRIEHVEKTIEDTLILYDFRQIGKQAFQNKRVLVVDDDDRLRAMLLESLKTYGYNPIGAVDGSNALDILEKEDFDIVITDIRMPEMDGITLMKEIKTSFPRVPVVIITGYSHAYTRQKVFEAGADGFISKPFRLRRIEEILRNFLGGMRYC